MKRFAIVKKALNVKECMGYVCILYVLTAIAPAWAEDTLWRYQLGVRVGVLGAGIEASRALSSRSVMRLSWQEGESQHVNTDVGVAFDEETTLRSTGIYWDWHPWYNGFRTSVGLIANSNEIQGVTKSGQAITINERTYDASQLTGLSFEADFRRVALYFGLGWSLLPDHYQRWSLTLDSGLFVQRRLELNLEAVAPAMPMDAQLATDLISLESALTDSLEDRWIIPSFMVGMARTF